MNHRVHTPMWSFSQSPLWYTTDNANSRKLGNLGLLGIVQDYRQFTICWSIFLLSLPVKKPCMHLTLLLLAWSQFLSKVSDFNLPHLHLAPPLGFTNILGNKMLDPWAIVPRCLRVMIQSLLVANKHGLRVARQKRKWMACLIVSDALCPRLADNSPAQIVRNEVVFKACRQCYHRHVSPTPIVCHHIRHDDARCFL